jgi:hypothetical protein
MRTAALILTLAVAGSARAQFIDVNRQAAPPRPALSPFLNMLRGGNPAANYYLGVLPEQDRRAFQNDVRSSLGAVDFTRPVTPVPETVDDLIPALPQTGHAVGFQFYGNFYRFGQAQPRTYLPYSPGGGGPGTGR